MVPWSASHSSYLDSLQKFQDYFRRVALLLPNGILSYINKVWATPQLPWNRTTYTTHSSHFITASIIVKKAGSGSVQPAGQSRQDLLSQVHLNSLGQYCRPQTPLGTPFTFLVHLPYQQQRKKPD